MGGQQLKPFALGVLALLLGAVAPAAASPAPADHGSALPGTAVTASPVSSRAPRIGTGRYVTRLPSRGPTYLRVHRSAPGTTVHVGVQLVGRGGSVGEGFDVGVGTKAGQSGCGSAVDFRPTGGEISPVLYAATSTWASVEDDPCVTARDLYVTIHPPNDAADAGLPIQLRVYEEPAVDDESFSLLTTPSPATWSALQPSTPHPVAAAHVVDRAPLVRDGTYRLRLPSGEQEFLAVPMSWGDSLHVQLDARLPADADPGDPGLEMQILGPLLDHADTGGLGTDPDIGRTRSSRTYRSGVMTHPIAYINRDTVDAAYSGADLAGVHYVVLSYEPQGSGVAELPVRITVQRRTGGGQSPLYSSARGVHPPIADSRLVDGSLARQARREAADASAPQPSETISSDDGFPWLTVGLVLAGLILAGGIVDGLIHLRGRRRRRYYGRHSGSHRR